MDYKEHRGLFRSTPEFHVEGKYYRELYLEHMDTLRELRLNAIETNKLRKELKRFQDVQAEQISYYGKGATT